jgi:hypothetical protein
MIDNDCKAVKRKLDCLLRRWRGWFYVRLATQVQARTQQRTAATGR